MTVIAAPIKHPFADEVHVWRFALDAAIPWEHDQRAVLSDVETERMTRFKFARDRRRFQRRRIYLRLILAKYLQIDPASIEFSTNRYGKPIIDSYSPNLHFSTSHSEELGILLVSAHAMCGIDIEHTWHGTLSDGVIVNQFSTYEKNLLLGMHGQQRKNAFLNCWTGKEAYLKALGFGLLQPLDSFTIEPRETEQPGLVADEITGLLCEDWKFYRWRIADAYVATVAQQSSFNTIQLFCPNEYDSHSRKQIEIR